MSSLYIRGVAMGLVFTPLSSLGLLTVPREKMAQASGISNTIRQISGSLGVAFLSSVLTTRISFHTEMFGGAVQSGSQAFQTAARNLAFYIQQHSGGTFATAMKQAQSQLISSVGSQAFIQGIDDDFLLAAIISLIGFIPIILMRTKVKGNAGSQIKAHLEIID